MSHKEETEGVAKKRQSKSLGETEGVVIRKKRQRESLGETEGATGRDRVSHKEGTE
jgi:hypothetical protein